MPNRQREKGQRAEQTFVEALRKRGLGAQRVPGSGNSGGKFSGDVRVWTVWNDWLFEGKCRANGWAELYRWLEPDEIDALFLKADNKPHLVVMTAEKFAELVEEAERGI